VNDGSSALAAEVTFAALALTKAHTRHHMRTPKQEEAQAEYAPPTTSDDKRFKYNDR
jgi:hypothetical protein